MMKLTPQLPPGKGTRLRKSKLRGAPQPSGRPRPTGRHGDLAMIKADGLCASTPTTRVASPHTPSPLGARCQMICPMNLPHHGRSCCSQTRISSYALHVDIAPGAETDSGRERYAPGTSQPGRVTRRSLALPTSALSPMKCSATGSHCSDSPAS